MIYFSKSICTEYLGTFFVYQISLLFFYFTLLLFSPAVLLCFSLPLLWCSSLVCPFPVLILCSTLVFLSLRSSHLLLSYIRLMCSPLEFPLMFLFCFPILYSSFMFPFSSPLLCFFFSHPLLLVLPSCVSLL